MCWSSSSCESSPSSAADGSLLRANLLGVDLFERGAFLEARDLPLGCIRRRNCEVLRGAQLLCDGQHPGDQLLERRTRGPHLVRRQVDQVAGQPPADRAPEVLLDLAVRRMKQLLALVERAGD